MNQIYELELRNGYFQNFIFVIIIFNIIENDVNKQINSFHRVKISDLYTL